MANVALVTAYNAWVMFYIKSHHVLMRNTNFVKIFCHENDDNECTRRRRRWNKEVVEKEIKSDLLPEQNTFNIYVNNLGMKSITMQNKCCARSIHIDGEPSIRYPINKRIGCKRGMENKNLLTII